MKKHLFITVAALMWLALTNGMSVAKDSYPHKKQIAKHPEALAIVEAREMKFLIDPAKVGTNPEKGLNKIWERVKKFAKKEGVNVEEKGFAHDGFTYSTKVYYDTAKGEISKKGYVVRITTKYIGGKPATAALTVKFIDRDHPERVFSAMEDDEDASVEENVGPAKGYTLDTYLEKATKMDVDLNKVPVTMADFSALIPHLETLGISPKAKLTGIGAYSIRMKPGFVHLPGMPFPATISMEAWLPVDGESKEAFVYDFSYGFPTGDYYDMAATHSYAESMMQKLYKQLDKEMGLPSNAKWRGSKASYLRQGVKPAKYSGKMKASELRFYKEPAKNPDGTVTFNDDPS
ncbi:MAG: hypothetical protein ABFR97_06695 [Thermodesulfobacteriota bacterium]